MSLAFVTADATSRRTRFYRNAENVEISGRLPRHDATSGAADVTAVQTEPDAAGHFLHVGLGEVGIGTARAACCALQAFGYTAYEHLAIEAGGLGMGLHHLASRHPCQDIIDLYSADRRLVAGCASRREGFELTWWLGHVRCSQPSASQLATRAFAESN